MPPFLVSQAFIYKGLCLNIGDSAVDYDVVRTQLARCEPKHQHLGFNSQLFEKGLDPTSLLLHLTLILYEN